MLLHFPAFTVVKTTGGAGFPDTANARVGEDFPWRIVVTNTDPAADATAVHVRDVLPKNWVYSGGGTLTPGGTQAPGTSTTGGVQTLDFVVATLGHGASTVITFNARPQAAAVLDPGLGAGANVNSSDVTSALDAGGNSGHGGTPYASPAVGWRWPARGRSRRVSGLRAACA